MRAIDVGVRARLRAAGVSESVSLRTDSERPQGRRNGEVSRIASESVRAGPVVRGHLDGFAVRGTTLSVPVVR